MKNLVLILFSQFFITNSLAQSNYYKDFYNSKGQLYIDTNFKLQDLNDVPYIPMENDSDALFRYFIMDNPIIYPIKALESNIEGEVVIEMGIIQTGEMTSDGTNSPIGKVSYIKLAIRDKWDKESWSGIFNDTSILKKTSLIFPQKNKFNEVYKIYIPIRFIIEEGRFEMEKYYKNGAINIKATIGWGPGPVTR